jgi:hypothetical protein
MARFQPIRQTLAGLDIQAQAQAGTALTFTRVQIGDGIAPAAYTAVLGTDEPFDLDDVVSPVRGAPIISVDAIGQGRARVRAMADNRGAALPFVVRELGIFATDPLDGVEKLYAYTNAGDGFDSIPADDGSPPTELVYDLMTIVGAAQNVTAGFNSQVWASADALETLQENTITTLAALLTLQASTFNRHIEGML